jgi:KUP system potassium uptake protein
VSSKRPILATVAAAAGVVYGDIGTSPLYAFSESLKAAGGADAAVVLGVLSLIFWSLAISVTVKYVMVMLRADNEGEGGILALFALAQRHLLAIGGFSRLMVGLALAGTALFFCDALITPAISVLSAVEGLELLNPGFNRAVLPVTLGVLAALFMIQKRGTHRVAALFGPVMIVWFAVLAWFGLSAILRNPQVLAALDPSYGVALLAWDAGLGLVIVGAVFLAITGAEALYADMGHFGRRAVRTAWFGLVWPALLLNYFGQGALVLAAGEPIDKPFYALIPQALLPWMIALATAATVIASQATITGAFSIARQAIQLDVLPRMRILQTSSAEHGQIYVPAVNLLMFLGVLAFVGAFGSSSALAGAYGAAVVGTMFVTTVLGAYVALMQWSWPKAAAAALFGALLAFDLVLVAGNLSKIDDGGWVPITLAAILFVIFTSWRSGRMDLRAALMSKAVPLAGLPRLLEGVQRNERTGVFLVSVPGYVPSALLRNLEHNRVAPKQIVILNFEILRTPRLSRADRVQIEALLPGVHAIDARFGFMETPDVNEVLIACRARGLVLHVPDCSFFLGWHLVHAHPRPGWQGLKRRLFEQMQRRSAQAAEFFRMPTRGVVVLATAVEI